MKRLTAVLLACANLVVFTGSSALASERALDFLKKQSSFNFDAMNLGDATSQIASVEDWQPESRYILNFGTVTYGQLSKKLACHISASWMQGKDLEQIFVRTSGLNFKTNPEYRFSAKEVYERLMTAKDCLKTEWDPDAGDGDQGPRGGEVCVEYSKPYVIGITLSIPLLQLKNSGSVYIQCQRSSSDFSDTVTADEFHAEFGRYLKF